MEQFRGCPRTPVPELPRNSPGGLSPNSPELPRTPRNSQGLSPNSLELPRGCPRTPQTPQGLSPNSPRRISLKKETNSFVAESSGLPVLADEGLRWETLFPMRPLCLFRGRQAKPKLNLARRRRRPMRPMDVWSLGPLIRIRHSSPERNDRGHHVAPASGRF